MKKKSKSKRKKPIADLDLIRGVREVWREEIINCVLRIEKLQEQVHR
jgi:hypothetical protein